MARMVKRALTEEEQGARVMKWVFVGLVLVAGFCYGMVKWGEHIAPPDSPAARGANVDTGTVSMPPKAAPPRTATGGSGERDMTWAKSTSEACTIQSQLRNADPALYAFSKNGSIAVTYDISRYGDSLPAARRAFIEHVRMFSSKLAQTFPNATQYSFVCSAAAYVEQPNIPAFMANAERSVVLSLEWQEASTEGLVKLLDYYEESDEVKRLRGVL